MTPRIPTKKQYDQLRRLLGLIVLTPGFREWQAIVNRGWVEAAWEHELKPKQSGRYKSWPPLRLSPAGYRALADAIEAYGFPDPDPQVPA